MTVTLTGMMGSGKSTIGKRLATVLAWEFIDLDQYIVEQEGCDIPSIFAKGGESLFREIEHRHLLQVLENHSGGNLVLSLGGGTLTVEESRSAVAANTVCIYLKTTLKGGFADTRGTGLCSTATALHSCFRSVRACTKKPPVTRC